MGEIGGRENIRTYCMKKNLFSIKGKNNKTKIPIGQIDVVGNLYKKTITLVKKYVKTCSINPEVLFSSFQI